MSVALDSVEPALVPGGFPVTAVVVTPISLTLPSVSILTALLLAIAQLGTAVKVLPAGGMATSADVKPAVLPDCFCRY